MKADSGGTFIYYRIPKKNLIGLENFVGVLT